MGYAHTTDVSAILLQNVHLHRPKWCFQGIALKLVKRGELIHSPYLQQRPGALEPRLCDLRVPEQQGVEPLPLLAGVLLRRLGRCIGTSHTNVQVGDLF